MKIVPCTEIDPDAWDGVADRSDDAWLMHRRAWIDMETLFFVGKNLSFAVVEGGEIQAVQPLYFSWAKHGTPFGERLVHSGLHRSCGLAIAPGSTEKQRAAIERSAMSHVLHVARMLGADRIQLGTHTLAPSSRSGRVEPVPLWAREYGFHLGIGLGPGGIMPAPGFATLAADQLVDLERSEDEIFAGLDEACRRAVRKARREGLVAKSSADPADLDRYWHLARLSAQRTGETLPSRDFYEQMLRTLGPVGRAVLVFARRGDADLAALFLLRDKKAVSFLAGVSDPAALACRPNDFAHWAAMTRARDDGAQVYRLGPIFPEVPRDWPVAKVSSFKGKFGGRSVPITAGSLFLDAEKAAQRLLQVHMTMAATGTVAPQPVAAVPSLSAEFVAHRLRLMGVDAVAAGTARAGAVVVVDAGEQGGLIAARKAAAAGMPAVVLRAWLVTDYLEDVRSELLGPAIGLRSCGDGRVLRTFHPVHRIEGEQCFAVAAADDQSSVWSWLPDGRAGLLLAGTDLSRDLILLTQGDPARAGQAGAGKWGFDFERPNYLFEAQVDADRPDDRPADWWVWMLRQALVEHGGVQAETVLPFGAPGAVIVTGDDDQATLDHYRGQAARLVGLPVTYFLHPLARFDTESLSAMGKDRMVEWELHPDALETPDEYDARLAEQAEWFERLVGRRPRGVRNHGYLNRGYWRHADSWIAHGMTISSNLPGFDGCVLNGSLLPGRLALNGHMTPHWSLLTLFGDGVFFIHQWNRETARQAVHKTAASIIESGVPGIIVMNLHPANHVAAAGLHEAAHDLVDRFGFAAMTLGAANDWFSARDEGRKAQPLHDIVFRPWGSRAGQGPLGRAAAIWQTTAGLIRTFGSTWPAARGRTPGASPRRSGQGRS